MDGEPRYGGDYGRVALFGESQGGCTALDAATTHAKCVGGVFCSFGQLYSATPVSSSNKQLKVVVWHGSRDATIAPSLCLRSLSRLLDRGYKKLTLHVEDGLGHCENSATEAPLAKALKNWGFVSRDKPRRVSHAAAPPPAKPELPAAKPASPRPAKKTPPGSPKKPAPKPAAPPGLSKAPPPPGLPRAAPAPAPAPAKKAAPAPPGLGAPAAGWQALHQFPCAACGATDPALFSKTQLSKGATRRCKACVSGEPKPPGMAAKPPPQAPVPMDEDSDSELEGYA
ncbi:hypothetical protein JL722_9666 [Aureococcus anophagefferens]|nr:hypothetical protein JL722_9666 [Aureococcus anophagefferens]